MQNYVKYKNGIRVDMMGNYHGGCKKSCCQNSWGFPTKKGINNNCKIKLTLCTKHQNTGSSKNKRKTYKIKQLKSMNYLTSVVFNIKRKLNKKWINFLIN